MSFEQHYLHLVSGDSRGPLASAGRAGLLVLEGPYRVAVGVRNQLFDRGLRRRIHLDRPTISIGNLTVGGTGKTPFTAWLAGTLRSAGMAPAVLMRGYKARPGEAGDEQRLLQELLGSAVPIAADPDRARAAGRVLAERPEVDVFLLDDGFQHRRVQREVDVVLIDATQPFGHGHVLPRGLLREPISGLRRASAVVITRASLASTTELNAIRRTMAHDFHGPVFTCDFAPGGLRDGTGNAVDEDKITGARVVAACGIGNPAAFFRNLHDLGLNPVEQVRFSDHHDYAPADAEHLSRLVHTHRAAALVVTAKDWVKLRGFWPDADAPPVWIPVQETRLSPADEAALLELIFRQIRPPVEQQGAQQGGPASGQTDAHRD